MDKLEVHLFLSDFIKMKSRFCELDVRAEIYVVGPYGKEIYNGQSYRDLIYLVIYIRTFEFVVASDYTKKGIATYSKIYTGSFQDFLNDSFINPEVKKEMLYYSYIWG